VVIFLALYFWSLKKGIPNTGTPWYTASWKLCSPHCVINNLIFRWAVNGEKQNVIRKEKWFQDTECYVQCIFASCTATHEKNLG
jgi:hypothetical protein